MVDPQHLIPPHTHTSHPQLGPVCRLPTVLGISPPFLASPALHLCPTWGALPTNRLARGSPAPPNHPQHLLPHQHLSFSAPTHLTHGDGGPLSPHHYRIFLYTPLSIILPVAVCHPPTVLDCHPSPSSAQVSQYHTWTIHPPPSPVVLTRVSSPRLIPQPLAFHRRARVPSTSSALPHHFNIFGIPFLSPRRALHLHPPFPTILHSPFSAFTALRFSGI